MSPEQARPLSEIRIGFLVEALADRYWQELVLAVDGAARDPAGQVVLRRHGVVVARQEHERDAGSAWQCPEKGVLGLVDRLESRRHERADARRHLDLVPTLGRDVDELERPAREAIGPDCTISRSRSSPRCGSPPARR